MKPIRPERFRALHGMAVALIAALSLCATPALATFDSVTLTTSVAPPQRVGTSVVLEANVVASDPSLILYRFEYRVPGGDWRLLQDFRERNVFRWVTLAEGNYEVRVLAVEEPTDTLHTDFVPYALVSPGVIANAPVIFPTSHPAVVMFSNPPCAAGALMRVRAFVPGEPGLGHTTHFKPCVANRGVNHYVAGMRENTTYALRSEVFLNGNLTTGPIVGVKSGQSAYVPNLGVLSGPDASTSFGQPVHVLSYISPQPDGVFARATDLSGRMVWSMGANIGDVQRGLLVRPVNNGTFMVITTEGEGELGGVQSQFLRELDLVGNTVRETNIPQINRQLEDLGETQFVGSFHHEARYLPDGKIVVLLSTEKILTDVQGPGDVNVYGESVAVLDKDLQVLWYWDSFEHIDNADLAVLGEVCAQGQPGCPPLFLGDEANDWLHMNAIAYSPADGHLILSARHQEAVYKIDYADGAGTGALVWELGEFGDFTMNDPGASAWPWFSHQHDPNYAGGFLVIYDNGNARFDALGSGENSRGQVYVLDETNLVANLVHNFDLGSYAAAVGSSQRLINGNFHFLNGFLGTGANPAFGALEVTPAATASWIEAGAGRVYRSHRMRSLYRLQ